MVAVKQQKHLSLSFAIETKNYHSKRSVLAEAMTVFMNIDLGLEKHFSRCFLLTFLGVFRNVLVLYLLDISAQRTEG